MKFKKLGALFLTVALGATLLAGCGNNASDNGAKKRFGL